MIQRWTEKGEKVSSSRCVQVPTQANCDIVSPIISSSAAVDENTVTCVKCKSGFIQIDEGINYVGVNPNNLSVQTDLGVHRLGFGCAPQGAFTYHSTNSMTAPENCVAYSFNQLNQKWDCRRCKRGWTGKADSTNVNNLLCNKPVEDCDNSAYWGGFF